MNQPSWLEFAWRELGQREVAGVGDNPRVQAYFREAGASGATEDSVPWCAAFAGACLKRAGFKGSGSLMARSYLVWGEKLASPRLGAIAVLSRSGDPTLGHVGFIVGWTTGTILLLGGNQSDAVTVAQFSRSRVIGLRWPRGEDSADLGSVASPKPQTLELTPMAVGDAGFQAALKHVLEMEGGYTEDRYDPGGPTNKGITLGVFAAWRKVELTAENFGELKGQLRAISPREVGEIYKARYWRPAHSAELPSGLALMHFDAAVNHGVGTAIRCLQEAAGVEADGEIGPITQAALAAKSESELLAAYADIRRRRYRALSHFWRFGRGWLARVDRTLARALALAGHVAPVPSQEKISTSPPEKGNGTMSSEEIHTPQPIIFGPSIPSRQSASPPAKWWTGSITIWGAIMTAVSTVLPALGPVIGLDVTGEMVRVLGEQIVQSGQALGGLFGTAMTIYGRLRAVQPLVQRSLTLRV